PPALARDPGDVLVRVHLLDLLPRDGHAARVDDPARVRDVPRRGNRAARAGDPRRARAARARARARTLGAPGALVARRPGLELRRALRARGGGGAAVRVSRLRAVHLLPVLTRAGSGADSPDSVKRGALARALTL